MFRIVRTSNFNLDFYDEEFVENIPLFNTEEEARAVAELFNHAVPLRHPDYWVAKPSNYVLHKGKIP